MQMMDAASAGKLKGLWAIGYDIALTNPNANATIRALRSLDLVIVQDMFLNEIARERGSVFFPAASSFERDGTFMNSERRIQRVRKAIEPPGEAKADWEIICEVARAMGKGDAFNFHSPEEIWDEIRSVWKVGRGITYARLENGGLQWPCPSENHPGTTILHQDSFAHAARAPLRRIEFAPTGEITSPRISLPAYERPHALPIQRRHHAWRQKTVVRRRFDWQEMATVSQVAISHLLRSADALIHEHEHQTAAFDEIGANIQSTDRLVLRGSASPNDDRGAAGFFR